MITKKQYSFLDALYEYYNNELFGGSLCDCMITTNRHKKANGYFAGEAWIDNEARKANEDNKRIHEISLNPDHLDRASKEWQSTLVHEMVHLWQSENGEPSRKNYHNYEWAEKMEAVGLMPSSTGMSGGKKTGQKMTHYIIEGGLFIEAFNRLKEKELKYTPDAFLDTSIKSGSDEKSKSKTKYTCECGFNVWGKPGLEITCNECKSIFQET